MTTTTIAENCGRYPHWHEKFQLDSYSTEDIITIEVYDTYLTDATKSGEILLGKGKIAIAELEKQRHGLWISFVNENKEAAGVIVLGSEESKHTPPEFKGAKDTIKPLPISDLEGKKKKLPAIGLQDCTQLTRGSIQTSKQGTSKPNKKRSGSWFGFLTKKNLEEKPVEILETDQIVLEEDKAELAAREFGKLQVIEQLQTECAEPLMENGLLDGDVRMREVLGDDQTAPSKGNLKKYIS